MKKAKVKKDPRELLAIFKARFVRYRAVIFVVFIALVYGYLFWQINNFNNAKPNPLQVSNQASSPAATIPRIDPATIQKIEQLKDNSVNVQALFNQSRNNPFAD